MAKIKVTAKQLATAVITKDSNLKGKSLAGSKYSFGYWLKPLGADAEIELDIPDEQLPKTERVEFDEEKLFDLWETYDNTFWKEKEDGSAFKPIVDYVKSLTQVDQSTAIGFDLNNQITELVDQLSEMTVARDKAVKDLSDARSQFEESHLKSIIEQLQTANKQHKADKKALKAEIEAREVRETELVHELEEWKSKYSTASLRAGELNASLGKELAELKTKYAPVKLPKVAFEWFETLDTDEFGHLRAVGFANALIGTLPKMDYPDGFIEWIKGSGEYEQSLNQLLMLHAIGRGYTLKKEKKYHVVFTDNDGYSEVLAGTVYGVTYIEKINKAGDYKSDAIEFTESEINSINPKYMAFAVEVEE
ncbi:DUF1642 domain-containing protein [Periweissella cryptocerci]|uniref:DUF1642 domain-containing protein n=1 Tax=Periweissella cryptocerci TaxID=2506420 RepID=A0A4P6YRV8_9LACO|nr:DUF1642 domain-containing protein [Periweissella cryptocerci]QBO35399.1 DUF1642 domain-containing protein [Periweissella cryptocerci]